MHATLPLLQQSDFPILQRGKLNTLQVNLGYRCNQQCLHCHVNASPHRKEVMGEETLEQVLHVLQYPGLGTLDITGGAPELHPHFRDLVRQARALGKRVIDRCNLTILEEPGYEDLAGFLANHQVEITASLPCYLEENVDAQRGKGVFQSSIHALKKLNDVGYAMPGTGLTLNLMYNPQGPTLPPPQCALESDYRKQLREKHGVEFSHLHTLTNMPIQRFGSTLISRGQFENYMQLLKDAAHEENLENVMCRHLISIDWRGYVYDCDFNQMLDLPVRRPGGGPLHIRDLDIDQLEGSEIAVADHCYGCIAGQGSSCGGQLDGSV